MTSSDDNLALLAHPPLACLTLVLRLFDLAGLLPQLLQIRVVVRPLEDEVAAEQVRVPEREHGGLGVAARDELEEGEPAGLGVELARDADRLELTVRTGQGQGVSE